MTARGKHAYQVLKLPPLTRTHRQTPFSQSSQSRRQNSNSLIASSYTRSSSCGKCDSLDKTAESLMELCNYLRKTNEALLSCLVGKPLRDRLALQDRMKQLYSIDLEAQFRESLGQNISGIISGLLQSPYTKVAMDLHQLVEDLDPYAMVDKLLIYGRKSLSCICQDYKKQFGTPIIMDVLRSFGDQRVSRLLTALIRGLLWPANYSDDAVLEAAKEVQNQETMLLEEASVLLVGLQKYGPNFLTAVSEAHRQENPKKPLLHCLRARYDASLFLLVRKLLDPTEAEVRIRDLASRMEWLSKSGGRELVHQLVMLAESPRVLSALNRQLLLMRDATLRDLVLRGCPPDCVEMMGAITPGGPKKEYSLRDC
uniref:PUM-HD domain-containing protein n=1 Tax=Macrostomum lignano TaxID=282301 RepID=A0A1I8G2I1_9PLAT